MKTCFSLIILLLIPAFGLGQVLSAAEARARIEKATPAALPQSPRTPAVNDLEEEHLKGKVRSMTSSVLEPDSSTARMRWEFFYDESGGLVKKIFYDYRGNPMDIRVFGYIDGKRVSQSTSIRYEYDPPPIMVPGARRVVAPSSADDRYESSYVLKYDPAKRPVEKLIYSNNGTLLRRSVLSYKDDVVETISYDGSGKANSWKTEKYDKKGNLIEASYPHPGAAYGTSVYNYKYEEIDSHGNWTRATVTGKEGQYGGGQKDFRHVEIRTIKYY